MNKHLLIDREHGYAGQKVWMNKLGDTPPNNIENFARILNFGRAFKSILALGGTHDES
jgi:hypothetical protein